MPYQTMYVNASLFTQHKGVKVYHVYKDDKISGGERTYLYSLDKMSEDDNAFDVRELPEWKILKKHAKNMDSIKFIKKVIRASIKAGTLQKLWKEKHTENAFTI